MSVNETIKPLSGFLFINKEIGPTSHDVVAQVRRTLPKGTKVGHAGTLDPLASGLLILGVGKATKEMNKLVGLDKEYEATITLGATSETDDAEGPIKPHGINHIPDRDEVDRAINSFLGQRQQLPPTYSAKKVGGVRLYKQARQGRDVVRKPHEITVYAIECLSYSYPELRVRIHCSSGTYIRSLARDLGGALKTGGYLSSLCRTRVGPFLLNDARGDQLLHTIEDVLTRCGSVL